MNIYSNFCYERVLLDHVFLSMKIKFLTGFGHTIISFCVAKSIFYQHVTLKGVSTLPCDVGCIDVFYFICLFTVENEIL